MKTTIGVMIEDKNVFDQLYLDWNIKNPTKRKTKEEFFRILINHYKHKDRPQRVRFFKERKNE